ncbi:MAG: hypothetical protein R3D27_10130 [Hyphomicrobiaceae bacterium]
MRHAAIVAFVATLLAASPALAQKKCPASALKASGALWGVGEIRNNQVVSAMHPCGRRIVCRGGNTKTGKKRSCRWG